MSEEMIEGVVRVLHLSLDRDVTCATTCFARTTEVKTQHHHAGARQRSGCFDKQAAVFMAVATESMEQKYGWIMAFLILEIRRQMQIAVQVAMQVLNQHRLAEKGVSRKLADVVFLPHGFHHLICAGENY